ncbi:MAG: RIP metalloprotease RseP [Gemmatimonadetes bacterium]|nr:RIP metalloprotease RseP [Gemmatimonadota bacterium]NNM06306.1 RIP metalloprotease RseP [Gemmatimonadota bacterium]
MTVLATVIVLGVLIFVHELGHFWAAKLVGVEVQRFSIGLGPRVWGVKWGETEYVVSAIPLGGYVKMGGMEDEVLDKLEGGSSKEPRVPGPRDFDGKPIWARTLVISAGVVMNMIFALVVYSTIAGVWGVPHYATTKVGKVFQRFLPEGTEALVQIPAGADLTLVGDRVVEDWRDFQSGILEAPPGPLTVEFRNPAGQVEIQNPIEGEDRRRAAGAVAWWTDAAAGTVEPGSPADEAGIEEGDEFLSVNGVPVEGWYGFLEAIKPRPDERVEIQILRDGRELTRTVTLESQREENPDTGEMWTAGKIGIWQPPDEVVYTRVGLSDALVAGYRDTVAVTGMILAFLRDLVTGNVDPSSVGSIVTIGQASGQAAAQGLEYFLGFMALFSVNLAILNLLPIPVLDGGHLVFLAIEAIRGGNPLSIEQRLRWSQVGFVVLLGIMVWALSNDFMRLFGR